MRILDLALDLGLPILGRFGGRNESDRLLTSKIQNPLNAL